MLILIKKLIKKIIDLPMQYAYISLKKEKTVESTSEQLEYEEKNDFGASIAEIYDNKAGIISVISDDGDYYTSKELYSLSQKYKIPVTIAGTVRNVYPHVREWHSMLKNEYFELINHSYNHYRMDEYWKYANNEKKLKHELIDSMSFFKKYFGIDEQVFVCPHNLVVKKGLELLIQHGVVAIRGYGPDLNELDIHEGNEKGQWHNLKSVGIMDTPKTDISQDEMRQKWLADCKDKWLIEMWHNIDVPGFQTISKEEAEKHFRQIAEAKEKQNYWCANYTSAVKYLKGKQSCEVYSYVNDNQLCIIAIDKKRELKNYHPLTVNIPKETIMKQLNDTEITEHETFYSIDVIPNKMYRINIYLSED